MELGRKERNLKFRRSRFTVQGPEALKFFKCWSQNSRAVHCLPQHRSIGGAFRARLRRSDYIIRAYSRTKAKPHVLLQQRLVSSILSQKPAIPFSLSRVALDVPLEYKQAYWMFDFIQLYQTTSRRPCYWTMTACPLVHTHVTPLGWRAVSQVHEVSLWPPC